MNNAHRSAPGGARAAARWAGVALLAGALLGMLAACGGEEEYKSKKWHGMDVTLESRPNPPREGMNEFLVTITDKHGRPGFDLIVSLRANAQEPWIQAIQDGQMGVYRRAVRLEPATDKVLEVQLQTRDATDVLEFPLKPQS
jgi:hypothetical protein